jgi:hypothetical protein
MCAMAAIDARPLRRFGNGSSERASAYTVIAPYDTTCAFASESPVRRKPSSRTSHHARRRAAVSKRQPTKIATATHANQSPQRA